jgi:hypothetical protein
MFAKVLFTGMAAAALALAQGGMGGGGGGGGMGGGGGRSGSNSGGMGDTGGMGGGSGGARQQKENKADQIVNRLKLSNDQRSEFSTIMETTFKDAAPIIQGVLKCRQDVANAMIQGKTEADLAPLTQALNDAQFQMTGVEVKTFQRIVAILKPNQVAKAPEAFELMADIFIPQGGGGGGGGRGRR